MIELTKGQEKEKLLQFIFGLDTAVFGTILSSILGEDPLPNVNQALSKVFPEEQVQKLDKIEDTGEVVASAIKTFCNSDMKKLMC